MQFKREGYATRTAHHRRYRRKSRPAAQAAILRSPFPCRRHRRRSRSVTKKRTAKIVSCFTLKKGNVWQRGPYDRFAWGSVHMLFGLEHFHQRLLQNEDAPSDSHGGSSPDCTIRYAVVRLMPIRRAACSTDNVIASSLWCSFVMVAPCSFVMIAPYERKGAELHIYVVPARRGH